MLCYWIWLSQIGTWKTETIRALLARFLNPKEIYYAGKRDFRDIPGIREKELEALSNKSLVRAERILASCYDKRINVRTFADPAYPERLRNIPDAPVVLYTLGGFPCFDTEPTIAVVGTRKASQYGMMAAKRMGYQIASGGGLLVSGMASGIDATAMKGALSLGRPVVGVLGCGVDVIYPQSEWELYEDIAARGCLISEYPPGTPPERYHFPRRNRIISGLSCGVLVVEAPERSGALITAQQALDQGRDVFVVPGNINSPSCGGSNRLLRQGAVAVTTGYDVLEDYAWLFPEKIKAFDLTEEPPQTTKLDTGGACMVAENVRIFGENIDKAPGSTYSVPEEKEANLPPEQKAILSLLEGRKLPVDEIIAQSGLAAQTVLAALTLLEIRGMVCRLPGKMYCLAKDSGNL